jgi:hypothetical protein
MLKLPNKQRQGHHLMEVQAECIKEWEEYICVLQKEMPALEVVVDSLKQAKNEVDRELAKIEGQVEDRIMFVITRKEEFLVLQTTFDT